MAVPERSQVIAALRKALVAWLGVYVVLIHLLVVWKWQTPPIVAKKTLNVETPTAVLEDASSSLQASLQQIMQEKERLLMQQQRIEETRAKIDCAVEQLERTKQATQNLSVPTFTNSGEWDDAHDRRLNHLQKLLDLPDLSLITLRKTLVDFKKMAIAFPVEKFTAEADTLPWEHLTTFFQTDFPEKNSSSLQFRCPSSMDQAQLERSFQEATRTIPGELGAYVDQSRRRLQPELQQALQVWVSTQDEVVHDVDSVDASCVTQGQAIKWLETALDALDRRKNLEQELSRAGAPRVPVEAWEDGVPASGNAATLRHVLDTPALAHQATRWIKQVLFIIGGYSETIDRWLDSLPHDVADQWMRRLLEQSGKITFSRPRVVESG